MDNSNNQSSQTRFLIAAVLSMVVLFGWSYFFAPTKPANNSNTAETAAQPAPQSQTPATTVAAQPPADVAAAQPDTTPGRVITVRSPLYEVKFDSKGAVATSWIILKNKGPKG